MMQETIFKTTQSKDVRVGDVEVIMDIQKHTVVYYYYRAESVLIGDIVDAIHDPMTGKFVGNRVTNCVEIKWMPLSYEGKAFTTRYHQSARLDIARGVVDVNDLVKEEEVTE